MLIYGTGVSTVSHSTSSNGLQATNSNQQLTRNAAASQADGRDRTAFTVILQLIPFSVLQ